MIKLQNEQLPFSLPPIASNIQETLDKIVNVAAEESGAAIAMASQKHKNGLIVRSVADTPDNYFHLNEFLPYGKDIFCYKVAQVGKPCYLDESTNMEPSHYLGVPIFDPIGEVFGTLGVRGCTMEYGRKNTERLMSKLAEFVTDELRKH